jgi:hypothetical protein
MIPFMGEITLCLQAKVVRPTQLGLLSKTTLNQTMDKVHGENMLKKYVIFEYFLCGHK